MKTGHLLCLLYNCLFGAKKYPAVRMDIFVPAPGKKCSIFGIKIYQKKTMIYRDGRWYLHKFMDFHKKIPVFALKKVTGGILGGCGNPAFMRVSAIYRKKV